MLECTCCQWERTTPDRQLFFDLLAEAQNKHSEIPDRTLCVSWLWSWWAVYFYQEPFQSSDNKNHSEQERQFSSKVYSPVRQNLIVNSAALQAWNHYLPTPPRHKDAPTCLIAHWWEPKTIFSTAREIFLICNSKRISKAFQVWPYRKMEKADRKGWPKSF